MTLDDNQKIEGYSEIENNVQFQTKSNLEMEIFVMNTDWLIKILEMGQSEGITSDLEKLIMNEAASVGFGYEYTGFLANIHDISSYYGYYDDGERLAFFQLAIIEAMQKINFIPDILHLNDYHTAFIPFLLKEKYNWISKYQQIKTVLTIHNIEFQGQYGPEILGELFGLDTSYYYQGKVRYDDCVNFMKTGIECADMVTTVSPTYAKEIQTKRFGKRLEYVLRNDQEKLRGILNGIDNQVYDPQHDDYLFEKYSVETFDKKWINKQELQKQLNLPCRKDVPLIGIVSRMTDQKGFGLIVSEMANLMKFDVQVVLLGTGASNFEHDFRYFNATYPDKCRALIEFNDELAHKIYGAADLLLMPSLFEPCGLSQLIAMRYGVVPIVHETGGLADTVVSYNKFNGQGNGFGFKQNSSFQMMQAIKRAIKLYKNQHKFQQLATKDMQIDHSWKKVCHPYIEMYYDLMN